VDFPEPQAPTNKINPRRNRATSFKAVGRPRLSSVGTSGGTARIATAVWPRCRNRLKRKRPNSPRLSARLYSQVSRNSRRWASERTVPTICSICLTCRLSPLRGASLPSTRKAGGVSVLIRRSEAPRRRMRVRRLCSKSIYGAVPMPSSSNKEKVLRVSTRSGLPLSCSSRCPVYSGDTPSRY